MKLKQYQEKVLDTLKEYLSALADFKSKYQSALAFDPDIARDYNFPQRAFAKTTNRSNYHTKANGIHEPLPDVYLKVPTGGGKTLLACHSIDLIQKQYLQRQTGLVLWIVPSTQIYRQTILALKDRYHPYRQILDISSGGRTLIKEKTEIFNALDISENLAVLMLMLPSANRQNKETLKVFRDAGGFTDFFPAEDNYPGQRELLKQIPNLDCFGSEGEVFETQIKTSLGNTLKLLKPLVVIDEGHKAYGDNARRTIQDFNPSFILELSATPPPNSNELVKITGRELHEEEMIKLDIHLVNKTSLEWHDTILATLEKLDDLENKAKTYEANTGKYIRPSALIQVERTGKDQRDNKFIHAEDVKEYLIQKCNVPANQIAIKSSEKDDIEGIDLFANDCEIRFIITKQALQEGWDFSFAYILTILTNPSSATGITQLVGRILRQPFGKKTGIKALDECYVYTFKQNASKLVREIKVGLESEGLGDIAGRIVSDDVNAGDGLFKTVEANYRPNFKKFEGKIFLPRFAIQEERSWRDINFEADILSAIDFEQVDLTELNNIVLNPNQTMGEIDLSIGYPEENWNEIIQRGVVLNKGTLKIDEAFLARQIGDLIPNPWIAYAKGDEAIKLIREKYKDHENTLIVESNFVFIIEYLKKIIEKQTNKLAEAVFKGLIDSNRLCFFLTEESGHHVLPSRIKIKGNKQLVRDDNSPIQKSLFDQVFEEEFNETEQSVAIYLDRQEKLLWWYRNRSRQDYHIQGWRKNKIYPDFITADVNSTNDTDYDKVFVLETKGVHLKANEDTRYKENVFELCNQLGARKPWKDLFNEFPDHNFEFQVVFEDEWQNEINRLIN
ncbi:MAG TPA: DEAD/DEAH box helicase family protein [Mucilaginibacter sp.]|jgi:type III restriction enzyme|nr:DEAD/DEAH box helicase family protein [Mucilaginibacter sp.]